MSAVIGGRPYASQALPTGHRGRVRVTVDIFPNELLIKIFANVGDTFYGTYYFEIGSARDLIPLMSTCRQWRDIIRGTPTLWRELVVPGRSLVGLAECLQRSQELPVNVSFFSSETNVSQAWHILRPHKDRIATLQFRWLQCAQIGERMPVLGEMNQLKALCISVNHKHNDAADSREHNGVCPSLLFTSPRLEKLELGGLIVEGPSVGSFSNVRDLVLHGYYGAPQTWGLTQFLAMLQSCVSLETFTLGETALNTVAVDISQGYPYVALRRLRELTIYGKMEKVSALLSHLEIGPEVNITLLTEEESDARRAAIAARAILPTDIQECRLPILKAATRVKVHLCEDSHEDVLLITGTIGLNPDARINIVLRVAEEAWKAEEGPASDDAISQYYLEALRLTPSIFLGAPVETLVCESISDEYDNVPVDIWRSLFSSYPTLRTLVVQYWDAGPIIRALASRQSPEDPLPVCRQLEYLYVRNAKCEVDRLEEIWKYVAWRAAIGLPLTRLRLELLVDHHDGGPVPDVSAFRAEFARLVAESTLIVYDMRKESDQIRYYQRPGTEVEFPFGDM